MKKFQVTHILSNDDYGVLAFLFFWGCPTKKPPD